MPPTASCSDAQDVLADTKRSIQVMTSTLFSGAKWKINITLGCICFTLDSLGSREAFWLQGAIIQKDSLQFDPCWQQASSLLRYFCIDSLSASLMGWWVRLSSVPSLPDVGHQGCLLAVDADAVIDSLAPASSRSPSPTRCSSSQQFQVLPLLPHTRVNVVPGPREKL